MLAGPIIDVQAVQLGAASAGTIMTIMSALDPVSMLALRLENGRLQVPSSACYTAWRAALRTQLVRLSRPASRSRPALLRLR